MSGLLSIFTMFINSEYKIVLLLFFKNFLRDKLLSSDGLLIKNSPDKFVELMAWLNEHFKDSIPSDLLAMKKLD